MKFSIEKIHHFSCFHCQKWFSVGDLPEKYKKMYCPFCGKHQEVLSSSLTCSKRKLTKIEAATAVAKAFYKRVIFNNKKRQEQRYYFCEICNSYHLTKKEDEYATNNRTTRDDNQKSNGDPVFNQKGKKPPS